MEQRPDQPPEGKLIAAAADRMDLSIREAARRAGLSYGRWRQIVMGYQNVSPGNFAAVHAPARTVAKMAAAVGVTPEQLETEGQRPDAAEALRTLAALAERHIDWPIPPQEGTPFTTQTLNDAAPFAYEANGRLRDLRREGVATPSGAELYPDDSRAAFAYDTVLAAGHTPEESVQYVATVQGQAERARREQHRDRSGTRGA